MVKSTFMRRLVGVAVAPVLAWFSHAEIPSLVPPESGVDTVTANARPSFTDYTDAELTEIAGRIRALNAAERRGLITEMRKRMAASGLKPKIEAHFGRIIQSADGIVTQVESIRVIRQGEYGRGRGEDAVMEAHSEIQNATKTGAIEDNTP